jgi:hypothetical protein
MLRPSAVMACAIAIAALSASSVAMADVLLIERVQASRSVELPRRGQQMAQVEQRFGTPERKHAPVGGGRPEHPPITRWDYPQFSVYFEHSHVVNSVLTRASELEIAPKPPVR